GHLQLRHPKHARGNRPSGWLVGRFRLLFLVLLSGDRGGPPRAIFFQIRKHKILLGQQPVALAKSHGRRILCEELAFSRPGPVTLRSRYMVAHRWSIVSRRASLLGGSATGQGSLWISAADRAP